MFDYTVVKRTQYLALLERIADLEYAAQVCRTTNALRVAELEDDVRRISRALQAEKDAHAICQRRATERYASILELTKDRDAWRRIASANCPLPADQGVRPPAQKSPFEAPYGAQPKNREVFL